jgi:glycosyltransferase involved in cell wall biosynthesis
MTADAATVSVVIPTHNRRDLLRSCLRGVMGQEDVDLEIIVVDDGSTDGTTELLQAIGDPRLRVIRHDVARGVAAARNTGIAAAHGQWVAFTDDDDLWAPSKLREQLEAGEARGAGFVYCGAVIFFDDSAAVIPDRPTPSPDEMRHAVLEWNPLPGGASAQIAQTRLLRDVGGFDDELRLLADWDMWIRLAAVTSMAAVDKPLVAYRRHVTNMVRGSYREHLHEFSRFVAKHEVATLEHGTEFDGVTFHSWLAHAQVLAGRPWDAVSIHLRAAAKYGSAHHLRSIPGSLVLAARNRAFALAGRPRRASPQIVSGSMPVPRWLEELRRP